MEIIYDYVGQIVSLVTSFVYKTGYLGIFIGMMLESTAIPIPSEAIMIPAGILVEQQKLNLYLTILISSLGNLVGGFLSYFIAYSYGKILIIKYGKFFLIKESMVNKTEKFFYKYGSISIFISRLIPVIRHYISLPAGLAKMNLISFSIYTFLGSMIWNIILIFIGRISIYDNHHQYLTIAIVFCVIISMILLLTKMFTKIK